jgi:hypothetical protein
VSEYLRKTIPRKKYSFFSQFQSFQSWSAYVSGPVVRQRIMVVGVCGQEGWSPHGIQEAIRARGNRKWCEQDTPFKGKPPVT